VCSFYEETSNRTVISYLLACVLWENYFKFASIWNVLVYVYCVRRCRFVRLYIVCLGVGKLEFGHSLIVQFTLRYSLIRLKARFIFMPCESNLLVFVLAKGLFWYSRNFCDSNQSIFIGERVKSKRTGKLRAGRKLFYVFFVCLWNAC
jgi:hypothetical protein